MSDVSHDRATPLGELTPSEMRSIVEQLTREGQSQPGGIVDFHATLERLRGDWQLLRDLLGFYFSDMPPLIDAIRTGIADKDWDRVRRTAHQVKGLIGNFGASEATVAAQDLERLSSQRTPSDAQQRLRRLELAVAEVSRVLRRFGEPAS